MNQKPLKTGLTISLIGGGGGGGVGAGWVCDGEVLVEEGCSWLMGRVTDLAC